MDEMGMAVDQPRHYGATFNIDHNTIGRRDGAGSNIFYQAAFDQYVRQRRELS